VSILKENLLAEILGKTEVSAGKIKTVHKKSALIDFQSGFQIYL